MTVAVFYKMLFGEFEREGFEAHLGELLSFREAEEQILERRTAAYMVHKYLLNVLKEEDVSDISPAFGLRDIYECRVCVYHIAQVYMKGIMTVRDSVFGVREAVEEEEAEEIINRVKRRNHNRK